MNLEKAKAIVCSEKFFITLGFLVTVVASCLELSRGRAENFVVFSDATHNFWNGINSYTQEFIDSHKRFFIYSPVFNVLFTPFAFVNKWVGALAYNIINYVLLVLALKNLPHGLNKHFAGMFWFLLLIIAQSIFCFQYNMVVCNCFLWAYIFLERNRYFWAILLIMISATTKIYGIVEIALLLCYPKVWRHFGYALLCGIGLLLLPALSGGIDGLITVYSNWFAQLTTHMETTGTYPSFIFMPPIDTWVLPNMRLVQGGIILLLGIIFLALNKRWGEWQFRTQVLGVLMGYIVLFSEAAEYHTYVIALAGFLLCYYTNSDMKQSPIVKVLYWLSLIFMSMMPIDLFCPAKVHRLINGTYFVSVYVYLLMWLSMVYYTIRSNNQNTTY